MESYSYGSLGEQEIEVGTPAHIGRLFPPEA